MGNRSVYHQRRCVFIHYLNCFNHLMGNPIGWENRPFSSSKKSHFQSEAKCQAIDMKMSFNYDANKTHFHNKGFAPSLVLKVRFFGTGKWRILSILVLTMESNAFLKSQPLCCGLTLPRQCASVPRCGRHWNEAVGRA